MPQQMFRDGVSVQNADVLSLKKVVNTSKAVDRRDALFVHTIEPLLYRAGAFEL